jgi:threonine synthase
LRAVMELAGQGFYAEPTSATAAAAFSRLLAEGCIGPDETTVLVLTGSGLKATQRIGALMGVV